ncbi:cytochrome P450 [Bradyrhizobium neotropicale]|uniref:Cytochrome n=1 Tax=Bradyrhizobium neotropicale TaxID=1497615 RepID=A0A176YRB7_9BRAD|nr:cytochrome P450 [Bradyrhizobium neotropicale]OAF09377.1 cytochrome [Bradyrhizobium neotropicale]
MPSSSQAIPTFGREPPVLAGDPFSDAVLTSPFEFQHSLREAGPVAYLPSHNVYAMGRYDEVRAALVNWQGFESGNGVGLFNPRSETPYRRPPSAILELDPPIHDAPRHALEQALGPRMLTRFRDDWARTAEIVVDELLKREVIDAVSDLAEAFPLKVFPEAMGIPEEGRENLLVYSDHNFNSFGPNNALVEKGRKAFTELVGWMGKQGTRESLRPDGLGASIWAKTDEGDLTAEQAGGVIRSLLIAGLDTTIHALGAIIDAFLSAPQQWQVLRAEPKRARVAFDEAIRWASPVQTFFRTATRDVIVADTKIPEGEKILMFLGAANRDPRRWDNPDHFDLNRDPSGHVGFGMGIHHCVGQHVARQEAEVVLHELARRVARIEPAGEPKPHLNNTLKGWKTLPVRLIAA